MSGLGRWIEGRLIGDAKPPATFSDMVRAVERNHPSARAAARALGVPESTWRRWKGGAAPKGDRSAVITSAWRGAALDPNRPTNASVEIKVPRGNRERTIGANGLKMAPGAMDRVADVYVRTGDREAAAREFVKGIGDDWYRQAFGRGMVADEVYNGSIPDDTNAAFSPV